MAAYFKMCCSKLTTPFIGICVVCSRVWQLRRTSCMWRSTSLFSSASSCHLPSFTQVCTRSWILCHSTHIN